MADMERGGWKGRKEKHSTEALVIGRMPPQNIEAEMAVLGAMLLDKEAIVAVEDMLTPADFYREQDAIIYQAILNLVHRGESADILTVTEELRRMGRLEDVGGILYINELPEHVITTKGIERHAEIVAGKSKLRQLIDAAGTIADAAYTEEDAVEDIVDNAEKSILQVTKDDRKGGFVPVGEAVHQSLENITRQAQNHEPITGLPTGFAGLDSFTTGLQKGNLVIVAARPSMGKTAFVLNIAKNISLSHARKTVAFFSLEMGRDELVHRLLSSTALIDSQRLKTGRIQGEKEWLNLSKAASVFMEAPLYIDDTPGVTVSQIRSKCRRLKAEKGLDVVIIDYLQLMTGRNSRYSESRQQEISEISRSLKSLARELNVPVIALSQLSRGPDARPNHRPMLSDLRESGSIEQDADLVCFLYRDAYYNKEIAEGDPLQRETEVILAKNRNGPTGVVKMSFAGEFTLFYELTDREDPEM